LKRLHARYMSCSLGVVSLLAAGLMLWAGLLQAGSITLITGFTEEVDGVHYLNADVQYALSDEALDALENGLPLKTRLEVEVIRPRRILRDQVETRFEQTHKIQFQPLTRLYMVENLQTQRRRSFQSYGSAISELARVEDLPVIEDDRLDPERRYEIRIRIHLEIQEHPDGLGLIARIFSNSSTSSGWYQWTLRS